MFSHCKNWPLDWLECPGNHSSPKPEADASRGFCNLLLYCPRPCPPLCNSFPFQSGTFACPIKSRFFLPDPGDSHWAPSDRIAFRPLPPPPWALALLAPTSSSSFCSDLLGACQRPFMTGLEKNNKAALPSNPLRNVKTRAGTHRFFVTSGSQCQLLFLASRPK